MVEKDFDIEPGDLYKVGSIQYDGYYKNLTINSNIMNTVTVKKEELVKVLTENRDVHQKKYDDAYKGYVILVTKALKKTLKKVEAGKKFDLNFHQLNKPERHTEDYQNVIDMLGVTAQEVVDIGMDDYQKYYKNNWNWHLHWHLSNKMYVDAYYATVDEPQ